MKNSSNSVYEFVTDVLRMLAKMADLRLDPILRSISVGTQSLIDEHKMSYGAEEEDDYVSDEEDGECVEIEQFEEERKKRRKRRIDLVDILAKNCEISCPIEEELSADDTWEDDSQSVSLRFGQFNKFHFPP